MSVAAKLSAIASSSSDQKSKTEEYKSVLASLFSSKDGDGLATFAEHRACSHFLILSSFLHPPFIFFDFSSVLPVLRGH